MAKIFRYVLRTDAGTAPNFEGNLGSLCICKPKIRLAAGEGDYVVAFLSTRFGFGSRKLSWIGKIEKKIKLGDYQLSFPDRADAIYLRTCWSASGEEELQHSGVNLHGEAENQRRDKSGKYALVMREFWYWGDGHKPRTLPGELAHLEHTGVGHASRSSAGDIMALQEWLANEPCGKHGEHRTREGRGRGCGPDSWSPSVGC